MADRAVNELSTTPTVPHSISRVYSLLQRLRSLRHRVGFGVSERIRWSRGAHRETPATDPPGYGIEQSHRVGSLQRRYQVRFELTLNAATSRNNYEYLDILDRAWNASDLARPQGGRVCDIGCASFWYAAALHGFFRPRELVGVEVEGHRVFRDGRSRSDYANGYVGALPNTRFVVADYLDHELPADLITAWFPFVTAAAILAWRLPLSLLRPERLFARIYLNLAQDGLLVMVNHGHREADMAAGLCNAAGLRRLCRFAEPGVLSDHRSAPAVLSCWSRT